MPTARQQKSTSAFDLIFLGTGTSGSVPNVSCLTAPLDVEPCQTCLSTLSPEGKKNIRRNTSAIVRADGVGGKKVTILIDTGKNFQAAAVEWFPKYGLRHLDAVLLTHGHADAMNGLDDLRGWTLNSAIQPYIDLYLTQATFNEVKGGFPYLVSREFASGGGDVPAFKWHIIDAGVPFEIEGTGIQVLPFCGADYDPAYTTVNEIMHACACQQDASSVPEETWALLEESRNRNGQPLVAVVDCLRPLKHTSHFGLKETVATARRIGAIRTYCVGFGHEVSHSSYEKIFGAVDEKGIRDELTVKEEEGIGMIEPGDPIWIRPAHDGLQVTVLESGVIKDSSGY